MILPRIRSRWSKMLDRQHQRPLGWMGRIIGERMAIQHWPETQWTIEQLNLLPQDHVLELGFGAGRALELALNASNRGRVVGVEISPAMIQAARMKLRRSPFQQNALLLRANIQNLPLAAYAFDKIFSIHTFYFWLEPEIVLSDLFRRLTARGKLMLTMSTAKRDDSGRWVFSPLQTTLEQKILPAMDRIGFQQVTLQYGPDSRAYNSVALTATKSI